MASDVEIVNLALTLLGDSRILSLDDDVKQAREAKAIYVATRDALLAGYNWVFAKTRTQMGAPVATAPAFEFSYAYQLPADCLRVIMLGDFYVGADLTDYRGAPTREYAIEGDQVLTNWGAPINIQYVKRLTETAKFAPNFVEAFGCKLAAALAEPLTQSAQKREAAEKALVVAIRLAVRANAIQMPPEKFADDEWLLSRL